ncbi:hypothetical protein [Actinoplanes subtropicus]|uniref:hypothetical protein n=1 Tax=Actinoplanes subtropicus TaxID=543632 RepID=UPI0004C32B08|nr:hypothetical protein [Actinoplanes subtropicus]
MTTIRLLAAALAASALLAVGPPRVPPPVAVLALLAAVLAVGELWLRAPALSLEPPAGRIGLGLVCGLISLPLIALALYLARVPIRAHSLAAGLAALTLLLGGAVLLRERAGGREADPRLPWTFGAIALPVLVALVVGGTAVWAYARLPHPPQPGYTSVALDGWAAGIAGPVAIPRGGLDVPIRVSSAGEPAIVAPLSVIVDTLRIAPPHPVPIAADTAGSIHVHVPTPPNGCLHRIEISLGAASTVFYGRGPAPC